MSTRVLRPATKHSSEKRQDHITALVASSGVQAGAILADPAWPFKTWSAKGQGRSASRHYRIEEIEAIKALPVAAYAARDCWLFLWCPCPHTPWLIGVVEAWGFDFSGLGFGWAKTTKRAVITPLSVTAAPGAKSPWHMGLGHTTRKNVELCWLGRRGNPPRLNKGVHGLIVAPVREHSRKPDEVYGRIQSYCAGPYLELFARQQYPGWVCVGDECAKFPVEAERRPLQVQHADAQSPRLFGADNKTVGSVRSAAEGRVSRRPSSRPTPTT
jgi:N6-adenosine-specific RNA methylase IME4